MDLNKFFSALEVHEEYPDDYFIGYYGFTVAGVKEKLDGIENEDVALKYLNTLRTNLIQIDEELKPYSFTNFFDFKQIELINFSQATESKSNEIPEKQGKSYAEAQIEYRNFLDKIELNEINNLNVRIIVEDVKTQRPNIDITSLRYEFEEFTHWIEDIIRKIFVIKTTSTVSSTRAILVETNKDESSILSSFHPELPTDIKSINIYIDELIKSGVKKPKGKIVKKILNIYEDKYEKIELFKEKSFFLRLIYDHINHRQSDWTKEKFINYAINR